MLRENCYELPSDSRGWEKPENAVRVYHIAETFEGEYFANFEVLWLFTKVFFTTFGDTAY